MSETVSLGGRPVRGFALGDGTVGSTVAPIARDAVTGAAVGAALGVLVDYVRTDSVSWSTVATYATVGAAGGVILGVI